MPKVLDDPALRQVEQKISLLGLAVGDAIEKMTDRASDRFGFALFIFDNKTQTILSTSDREKSALYAALSVFLNRQSH